jgi:hypothetical protein
MAIEFDTFPSTGGGGAVGTLQQVTDQGATTTTNIQTAQITLTGDLLASSNDAQTIGDETNRFITAYSDLNGALRFKAKNDSGVALVKGQAVYLKGISGTVPTVDKAQSNASGTMNAAGLALTAANDQAEVQIITFGNLNSVDTSSFNAGDVLYISSTTAGGLVNSAPTGESNLIQNIGVVVRSHASDGIIKVSGAGRSNATPNLDNNKVFLGNGSNQAVSTALGAINLSSFNDDLNALISTNNLSDLNNVATARTNLGLGTASTQDVGTTANDVVQLNASAQLPAVDGSLLTNITATDSTKLAIANNLSDLNNVATARTNLGLGTAATQDTGTAANNVVQLDGSSRLPAVDGSQLTNISPTGALLITNNLSDLNNASTARTNLGLGTASTQDVGTTANNVVQLNGSAQLPAVDGSLLTNITATDNTKLAIANNLSDLNNVATARTNLGLGTASTQDVGTAANNVVQLDGTAKLPAVDGSQLTNISPTGALLITNNLSDLNNATTARTNLGLGTAATQDVGTTANDVVQLNASAQLPAVDGSLLTNITATDSTKLAIANNLSDLNNVATARTNLGLGTASTQDVGTAANNVVQLDGTAKLPAVDGSQLTNISPTGALLITNNLSDLNNATTARTNLGLGTASTQDVGTTANDVVQLNASAQLPAVDGSLLTNITATDSTKLAIANNLSDLNNVATARTNLGLGTASTQDVGTAANNVVQLDGTAKLPAVDGSQLTNLPSSGGGFTYQSITSASSPVSGAASYHYSADTSGGAITVNLPALSGVTAGTEIRFKLKTAGNNLTLDGNSAETIDGSATYILSVQNQSVTCVSDGSGNWEII